MRRISPRDAPLATPDQADLLRAIKPGCRARIRGLTARPELNGTDVTVLEWRDDEQRWNVRGDSIRRTLLVRSANLDSQEATSGMRTRFRKVIELYGLDTGDRLGDLIGLLTDASIDVKSRELACAQQFAMASHDVADLLAWINVVGCEVVDTYAEKRRIDTEARHRALAALARGEQRSLRHALLAADCADLALPETATFAALHPEPCSMPLLAGLSSAFFVSHTTYRLPCEPCAAVALPVAPSSAPCPPATRTDPLSTNPYYDPRYEHVVHRFELVPSLACMLNEGLTEWALHKEAREHCRSPCHRPFHRPFHN